MRSKGIFVAATGQHVGKTTTCLGILSGLRKRYDSVGFFKPVGQVHVQDASGVSIDKDVHLFKDYFGLEDEAIHMSPVLIPKGFTRDFLDGQIEEASLVESVELSYDHLSSRHPFILVEGTGHVGVGSIVNLNNARVAAELGLDIILVVSGGLGSAIDEFALNQAMCERYNVRIRGVIANRVLPDKRNMIIEYLGKALARWNVPLIGCVPFSDLLSAPTMEDMAKHFDADILSGHEHSFRHFQSTQIVSSSVEVIEFAAPNQCVVTNSANEGLILEIIDRAAHGQGTSGRPEMGVGLLLTGEHSPSKRIIEAADTVHMPLLYAPISNCQLMDRLAHFTAKIRQGDQAKIQRAVDLVETHIDFDRLCRVPEGSAC